MNVSKTSQRDLRMKIKCDRKIVMQSLFGRQFQGIILYGMTKCLDGKHGPYMPVKPDQSKYNISRKSALACFSSANLKYKNCVRRETQKTVSHRQIPRTSHLEKVLWLSSIMPISTLQVQISRVQTGKVYKSIQCMELCIELLVSCLIYILDI